MRGDLLDLCAVTRPARGAGMVVSRDMARAVSHRVSCGACVWAAVLAMALAWASAGESARGQDATPSDAGMSASGKQAQGKLTPGKLTPGEQTPGEQVADWSELEETIRLHRDRVRMCGPLSAARVIQGWGLKVKEGFWEEARGRLSAEGVPLRQVVDWCREATSAARGVFFAGELDEGRVRRLSVPCIVVVNDGHHCLVLESVSADRGIVHVWDPSDLQSKAMPMAQLLQMWNGAAIVREGDESAAGRGRLANARWLIAGGCGLVGQAMVVWRWSAWMRRRRPCVER